MSVRTTSFDGVVDKVALYDSTSGVAFGPIFDDEDEAIGFLEHLEAIGERDPRVISAVDLAQLAREYLEEREA